MKILITRYIPTTLLMASGNALAHTGHLPDETVHGFLHVEHIVMLAAVGLVVYLVKSLYDK